MQPQIAISDRNKSTHKPIMTIIGCLSVAVKVYILGTFSAHSYFQYFVPSHIGLNTSLAGLWIKQPCRQPGLWCWGPFWPLCSQLCRSTATFCLHWHPPLLHESPCPSKVGCISCVCLFLHCCSVDAWSPCWR